MKRLRVRLYQPCRTVRSISVGLLSVGRQKSKTSDLLRNLDSPSPDDYSNPIQMGSNVPAAQSVPARLGGLDVHFPPRGGAGACNGLFPQAGPDCQSVPIASRISPRAPLNSANWKLGKQSISVSSRGIRAARHRPTISHAECTPIHHQFVCIGRAADGLRPRSTAAPPRLLL